MPAPGLNRHSTGTSTGRPGAELGAPGCSGQAPTWPQQAQRAAALQRAAAGPGTLQAAAARWQPGKGGPPPFLGPCTPASSCLRGPALALQPAAAARHAQEGWRPLRRPRRALQERGAQLPCSAHVCSMHSWARPVAACTSSASACVCRRAMRYDTRACIFCVCVGGGGGGGLTGSALSAAWRPWWCSSAAWRRAAAPAAAGSHSQSRAWWQAAAAPACRQCALTDLALSCRQVWPGCWPSSAGLCLPEECTALPPDKLLPQGARQVCELPAPPRARPRSLTASPMSCQSTMSACRHGAQSSVARLWPQHAEDARLRVVLLEVLHDLHPPSLQHQDVGVFVLGGLGGTRPCSFACLWCHAQP